MSSVNKDSHRRRHSSSQSGKTHLSPPSTLSLLSTSTSGSNSTVIPDRFLRSSLRPSKQQESKRPVTRTSGPARDRQTESVVNHSDKDNVTAVLSSNRWELKKTTIKEPVSKVSVTKEASPVKIARREPTREEPAETMSAPMEPVSVEKVRIGNRAKKLSNDHFDVFSFMVKDGQEVNSDAEEAEKEEEEEEVDEEEEEDEEEKEGQQKGAQGEGDVGEDEREDEEEEEEEDEDESDEDEDDQQENATNNVDKAPSTFPTSPHVSHPTLSSSCDLEVVAPPEIEQQQHIWRKSEASLHSDSGISVRSSSPERESPAPRHRHPHVRKSSSYCGTIPNPNYPGYYPPAPMPPVAYVPRTPAYPRDWSTYGNPVENPEVYYASTRPVVTQTMQRPARLPPPDHHHQSHSHQLIRGSPRPQTEKPPRQKKPGYDELAAAIDSRGDAFLRPIYRKFETLNHRILLYLQDEISEMEEELRELDLAITHEEEMLGNTHASRRAEAKLPSQLQWRRLELLNRSYTKVEQYNRALSSYSNLAQSLEPASKADINTYKSWISENAPIVEQETTFLRKERDLIAVSPKKSSWSSSPRRASYSQLMGPSSGPRSREEIETPVFIVAFTLVSTIIVFKVVPMILARLVISAVFGVATLGTIAPGVLSNWGRGLREWKRGIAIYTGVMLVLALVGPENLTHEDANPHFSTLHARNKWRL